MNEVNEQPKQELSSDINIITAEINAYKQVAGEAIFEIGRRLKHVKENDLVHGEWERWCREEAEISPTSARLYIRVFNRFNEKQQRVVGLSFRVLDVLTSFTDEELEQEYELPSGETKKLMDMSRKEIEVLKHKLRQAQQQAEVERKERERLEELAEVLALIHNKTPSD